jgi:eukaryotic-like serine/threonine-protein kinase
MSLSAGQRLGPYEIVEPLGAGGMGEVFLARDTRLGREVAVKVLPREFASDSDRRARFEREARAISALNHPNVCALFDVGRAEGPDGDIEYLVMERLVGQTLAARLQAGPLPVAEVVALGSHLASALAAAHRQGIVHRDLKPGNVVLTRSGAKLLDFGLARRNESEASITGGEETMRTLGAEAHPLTRVGSLVGTWPYLAPEQVRGRPADARTDVFALGCVLFEALAGRRAFPGSTPTEITSAILSDEPPDLREEKPQVPPVLAALVRQCLAKDPDARWQCADDIARGLSLVEAGLSHPEAEPTRASAASRWPLVVGFAGLAVAAVTIGMLFARRPPAVASLRFSVAPPAGVALPRPTTGTPLAVSPDGRSVVFVGSSGGAPSLWLWSAEEGQSRRLEGTVGATAPFLSPDGREIAYFAGDSLRRVPVAGGPATTIAQAPLAISGSWGRDGTILFTRGFGPQAGLYAVPAGGGDARALAPAPSLKELRAFPRFLPDGRHYLFLKGFGGPVADRRVCVTSLESGEPECVATCHSQAEYSATGHLLCVRSGTLVALPFDLHGRKVTAEAVVAAPETRWFGPSGAASFAVSADGTTLVHEPRPALSRLAWLDRSGREVVGVGEPGAFGVVQLAPDGRRAAMDVWQAETGGRDLWSVDTASGVSSRLTFATVDAWAPAWSPDGTRLAYAKADEGPPDVAVLHLDGEVRDEVLLRAPGIQFPRHWSPDGRLILYEDYLAGRADQRQLWMLARDGQTRRVASAPASTYHGRFSPDGRRIAYVSEASGRPEVYIADLDGARPPRRISRAGGFLPRFRNDGTELFFFQPDGMMMAVPPADESAAPRALFHIEGVTAFDFDYDVARDGQRFLVRLTSEPEGAAGLRIAVEWSRRLGAR